MRQIFLAFASILLCLNICFSQAPTFNEPIVLGYFPSWSESWTSADQNSSLREIPTHVNYLFLAFAKPDMTYIQGSYDISLTGIQVPYDGCTLKESIGALKNKGTEVILSVGGETYWTSNDIYANINYNQIKDLVDDMGFAGIDWDFEPNGSFANIGTAANVQHFIDFFNNSRAVMPRSEGYIMACAPSGVGAMGGQTNDDASSPFSYANRNTVTGESDVNLYNSTAQTNGINLYGFSATGHMIPVMQAVGNEIDIIALQGYNAGASLNRSIMYDAYAHYAEQYGFKVAAGVHYPDEPWGPFYEYTPTNVASLSNHIATHPDRVGENDGIMIWQLLLTDANGSAYDYMNVADQVLNGTAETTAVANANNYSLAPYSGGADDCGTSNPGGGNTYCGSPEYNSDNAYPNPNTLVYSDCKIWSNQWYANPNEMPGSNAVWLEVSECNEGPICTPESCVWESIRYSSFENGWHVWNDGGADSRRAVSDAPYAKGGSYCIRLRNKNEASHMTSDVFDLTGYEEVRVTFSYLVRSFETQWDDFWLQASDDGGTTFNTIEEWNLGDEFVNDVRGFASVYQTGPFTNNMVYRIRSHANGAYDFVYIDNVQIRGCVSPSAKLSSTKEENIEESNFSSTKIYPNPTRELVNIEYEIKTSSDIVIMIRDVAGKTIFEKNVTVEKGQQLEQINMAHLNAGLYFTSIQSGEDKVVEQLIKL
jgi:chitinase